MTSPLIDRLTDEFGYPRLDAAGLAAFEATGGTVCLFLTGDPVKNLETNDVAVVLPELAATFADQFRVGVVDRDLEPTLKTRFDVHVTPALIFLRDGAFIGAIPKVRDWADYRERIPEILIGPTAAAAE